MNSGIPDLRLFCHSIVANAQFRASKHFLEVENHGLIQMLEVWVAALDQDVLPTIPPDCVENLLMVCDLVHGNSGIFAKVY